MTVLQSEWELQLDLQVNFVHAGLPSGRLPMWTRGRPKAEKTSVSSLAVMPLGREPTQSRRLLLASLQGNETPSRNMACSGFKVNSLS